MLGFIKPHLISVGFIFSLYETAVLSQFTIIDTAVTWSQAQSECSNRGLELAVLDTVEKLDMAFLQITGQYSSGSNGPRFWIGLRWNSADQKFKWHSNNNDLNYALPWNSGEPNCMYGCSTPQPCIFIAYESQSPDTRTRDCQQNYKVICSQAITTESSIIETTAITTLGKTESSLTTSAYATDAETGLRAIVYCPSGTDSMCECRVVQNVSNVISNQGDKILYKVDKKTTKAYLRKHRSAYDGRMSAKILGYAGYAVLIGVASLVVVMDATRLLQTR